MEETTWKDVFISISAFLNAAGVFYATVWRWWLRGYVARKSAEVTDKKVEHEIDKDNKTTDHAHLKDVKELIYEVVQRERVSAAEQYLDRKARHDEDIAMLRGIIGKYSREINLLKQAVEWLTERENNCNIRVARMEQILIGLGHKELIPAEDPPEPRAPDREDDEAQPTT